LAPFHRTGGCCPILDDEAAASDISVKILSIMHKDN
jgi:hypothetical protein